MWTKLDTNTRPSVARAVLQTPLHSVKNVDICAGSVVQTSLLHMVQAQTLPDEAPQVGKIHPFSKIAVTFEPIQQF